MLIRRREKQFAANIQEPKKTDTGAVSKTQGTIREIKPSKMPEYMKHDLPDPANEGREFQAEVGAAMGQLNM